MTTRVPSGSLRARHAVAATADQLATQAAMAMYDRGGNAVDAAIAANAAIAVTGPHLCGLGGDLFALVRDPDGDVHALDASGRAGSGADAAALRADGFDTMPMRHDIRAVTVPGCVDGWMALHERFARLDLATVLAPATRLAADGFLASPLLVASVELLDERGRQQLAELAEQAVAPARPVRRPGVALTLQAIATGGRRAFYEGAFGEGLVALGDGWFSDVDLATVQADWVDPLTADAFGVRLLTMPPASQGYLALGAARLVDTLELPDDADDAAWAQMLVAASIVASSDRPDVLHDRADGAALVAAIEARADEVDRRRAGAGSVPAADGDTTYLCTADASGFAVSLIQSNASGFGSWLAEPTTGINLHNRGLGFSLQPDHPAELAPGRRPPHTLVPVLATRDGELAAVLGSMGGDAQPQIVLQLAARLFGHRASPAGAVNAPRFVLRGPQTGFDTWSSRRPPIVAVEAHAPSTWRTALSAIGHEVDVVASFDSRFGHAHVITTEAGGFAVAADPRARIGSAAGV